MNKQRKMNHSFAFRYLLLAIATVILAFLSVFASGYVNPEKKPFANTFHGDFLEYVKKKFDVNEDGVLSRDERLAVEEIHLPELPDSRVMAEWNPEWISEFPNLTCLECVRWGITELDVSKNTKLEYLDCSKNRLTELDVSGCPRLRKLLCNGIKLGMIVVSENPTDYSGLQKLTIGACPDLEWLECGGNGLTKLDLSGTPRLHVLDCSFNGLTGLDVEGFGELQELRCRGNDMETLKIRGCTQLWSLNCSSNRLTELDVRELTKMEYLDISYNRLASIDVSMMPHLKEFDCCYNLMSSLDVSQNSELEMLDCWGQPGLKVNAGDNYSLYYWEEENPYDYDDSLSTYLNMIFAQ